MKKLISTLILITFLLLFSPGLALAGQPNTTCPSGLTGIDTAIGCIPYEDINAFTGFFLGWAIGIGGGIAFVLMIYAGFLIITSSGNPQRLSAGKELLTSAVSGLILLLFSIFLLRIVGVDILQIPGL